MTTAPAITPSTGYWDYRLRPAKRGYGAERKKLMEALRMEETMLMHYTIMCGPHAPAEWLKNKEDSRLEIVRILSELDPICGPAKADPRREKDWEGAPGLSLRTPIPRSPGSSRAPETAGPPGIVTP